MRVLASGVSSTPRASPGRLERSASSAARAVTVSFHLARGTASSTRRHCTAFLPPMPSARVEK